MNLNKNIWDKVYFEPSKKIMLMSYPINCDQIIWPIATYVWGNVIDLSLRDIKDVIKSDIKKDKIKKYKL